MRPVPERGGSEEHLLFLFCSPMLYEQVKPRKGGWTNIAWRLPPFPYPLTSSPTHQPRVIPSPPRTDFASPCFPLCYGVLQSCRVARPLDSFLVLGKYCWNWFSHSQVLNTSQHQNQCWMQVLRAPMRKLEKKIKINIIWPTYCSSIGTEEKIFLHKTLTNEKPWLIAQAICQKFLQSQAQTEKSPSPLAPPHHQSHQHHLVLSEVMGTDPSSIILLTPCE